VSRKPFNTQLLKIGIAIRKATFSVQVGYLACGHIGKAPFLSEWPVLLRVITASVCYSSQRCTLAENSTRISRPDARRGKVGDLAVLLSIKCCINSSTSESRVTESLAVTTLSIL
jgi:hypothetical protein